MIGSVRQCANAPAWTVAAGIALLVTPVCGWLFRCGCDWPWRGLATHCNYFDATATVRCPWCEHPLASALAIVTSTAVGMTATQRAVRRCPTDGNLLRALLLGLAVSVAGLLFTGAVTLCLAGTLPMQRDGSENYRAACRPGSRSGFRISTSSVTLGEGAEEILSKSRPGFVPGHPCIAGNTE